MIQFISNLVPLYKIMKLKQNKIKKLITKFMKKISFHIKILTPVIGQVFTLPDLNLSY